MLDELEHAALLRAVATVFNESVEEWNVKTAALVSRIQDLEKRLAEMPIPRDGERGEKGEPGNSPDVNMIVGRVMEMMPMSSMKKEVFDAVIEAIPKPKDGRDGERGIDGKDGAPGKDGKDGERGLDGADGLDGKDGRNGRDADPIHPDTVELMVRKAVDALPRPKDGQPGDKGEPGRDAIQVEPLPLLEPDKIYSRGTYVLHEGGTIRAKRNARGDELDAWEVTSCGVAEREWSQGEDPGEIILRERATLGKERIYKFYFPFVEYVDVWRDTKDYRRGHMVTYGGSVWHCNVTGTKAKPGTEGGDWTLAVKEGRPGKHGENGKDYTPPQPVKLNGR